jgi:hypothetical protein
LNPGASNPNWQNPGTEGDKMMFETLLNAALNYAILGWLVFPVWWVINGKCACGKPDCPHPGKHPIGTLAPNGRNSASTDPEVIKRWWEECPEANVGVCTGPESGLVAADIDPRNGGEDSRKRMERIGNFPITPTASTGGGGEHLLFQHPGNGHHIKSQSGLTGYPGIDIKGDGGYIVAPPSRHISGGQYSWKIAPDTDLAKIPGWLSEILNQNGGPPGRGEAQAGETIPYGQRNKTLTSLAGSMRRRGMSPQAIEAILLVENQRCDPPLEDSDLRRIAASVGRYEPAIAVSPPRVAAEKTFLPPPPTFPMEIYPPPIQKAVAEIQEAHGVPLEIPFCALLGTLGACIGRARGIMIKKRWMEFANLWLGVVADSGLGKSPAVRAIQAPIFALEEGWHEEYRAALKVYDQRIQSYRKASMKEGGNPGLPPDPPTWRQLLVDDATTEALTEVLGGNPRGILWNRDELSGLILELDKYAGKDGGAKSRLMSAYDSGLWKVNRRDKSKQALIPHATLSILGTIQPRALPAIFSQMDVATGFLPRFIFVHAWREAPAFWTDATVSDASHRTLAALYRGLLALDFDGENPKVIGVSPEAKGLYEEWFNTLAGEPWVDTEAAVYEAVFAKLRGQCLRIALILHCVEALNEGIPELTPVREATMQRAILLADCFKSHQKRVWQYVLNPEKLAEASPLQKRVGAAILELAQEITAGILPTARITEQVNSRSDKSFHLSTDQVGKVLATLSLQSRKLPDGSARGVALTEADLSRMENLSASSVKCVQSVQGVEPAQAPEESCSVLQASNVSSGAVTPEGGWTLRTPGGQLGDGWKAADDQGGGHHGHLGRHKKTFLKPHKLVVAPNIFRWNPVPRKLGVEVQELSSGEEVTL